MTIWWIWKNVDGSGLSLYWSSVSAFTWIYWEKLGKSSLRTVIPWGKEFNPEPPKYKTWVLITNCIQFCWFFDFLSTENHLTLLSQVLFQHWGLVHSRTLNVGLIGMTVMSGSVEKYTWPRQNLNQWPQNLLSPSPWLS